MFNCGFFCKNSIADGCYIKFVCLDCRSALICVGTYWSFFINVAPHYYAKIRSNCSGCNALLCDEAAQEFFKSLPALFSIGGITAIKAQLINVGYKDLKTL